MREHIFCAGVMAEVYPDGQKITAAILEYDRPIASVNIKTSLYTVKNRTILRAYANTEPSRAAQGRNGNYVILELSLDDTEAVVLPQPEMGSIPRQGPGPAGPGMPPGGAPQIPQRVRKPLRLEVRQLTDLPAEDGTILQASKEDIPTEAVYQPIVDDFRQYEFKGIPYNLFAPKDYDKSKRYPIVMFIPDASANGSDPFLTLVQGTGAVVWASPGEQDKHPCFVLAPQIPKNVQLTRDDFTVSEELETIKQLLDDVIDRYSIDRDRVYATGQSQGCMASCELNVRYPDFFAASLLVSGQWNPKTMAERLAKQRLFIALSEGGPKEYPGMNAVVAALETSGAKVAKAMINARKDRQSLNRDIRALGATGANVLYAVYEKDTVLPDDGRVHPRIAHHLRGWAITYEIEAVRDWLFSQTRRRE